MSAVRYEIGRVVPGVEKRYVVSNLGRVTSYLGPRPRVLKGQRTTTGHLKVHIVGQQRQIHQLVMLAFVGPPPEGMEVRHLNGDPADNRLENLAYGTRSENLRDAVAHGTHAQAKKTHCPQGHEYSHRNERQRFCRSCHVEANRRYRAKKAGQ